MTLTYPANSVTNLQGTTHGLHSVFCVMWVK